MRKFIFSFICHLLFLANIQSQILRINRHFGDVSPDDFTKKISFADSSAAAVYLFNGGYINYVKNEHGLFDVQFTRFARIRLLNKSSFSEVGSLEIPLYIIKDYEQKLVKFAAQLYNMENGKMQSSYFDRIDLLEENAVKRKHSNVTVDKFAFPGIQEGSIIEYTYTIQYPGIAYIPTWAFQENFPCLYSEFDIFQPVYYTYLMTKRGLTNFDVDESYDSIANYGYLADDGKLYSQSSILSSATPMVNHVWALKNIPALEKELYISSLSNYEKAIVFELYAIKYPSNAMSRVIKTWEREVEILDNSEEFGQELLKAGSWIFDAVKATNSWSSDKMETVKNIYNYVKNNFKCDYERGIFPRKSLKETYEQKSGSIADINFLLTAMCTRSGLSAKPVLLSTRDHGIAPEKFPSVNNYNYLITLVEFDGKKILLDASNKYLSFGHLKPDCYNGAARAVDKSYPPIILSADSVMETKQTTVIMLSNEQGFEGSFTSNLGAMESYRLRQRLSKDKERDFFNDIKKSYNSPAEVTDMALDSLGNTDYPLGIRYNIKFLFDNENIIYFNPLLSEGWKENPFKSANRLYPVEMPFCTDETYVLNMEIPKGYMVDELPGSARVKLNENDGFFEYIVSKTSTNVQLKCRLKFNKANFLPDDYQTLRDFYSYVVKKEAEQIVFKKMK